MHDSQAIHFRLIEAISEDLSGEPNFPTCMDAATLIRDILKDPETSLEQVARVVSIEPLISSRVLRLANTAHNNPSGKPYTELGVAIGRLGFESVRTISLAVALDQMLKTPRLALFSGIAHAAWKHSLHLAAIARALSRRIGRINPDEAMLAGLVSDIGVFYLLYRASNQHAYLHDETLLMELLRGWQAPIGESLLHALGLPERIIASLGHPETSLNTESPCTLSDILYFSRLLAAHDVPWYTPSADALDEDTHAADRARYADLLIEASEDIRELHQALAA